MDQSAKIGKNFRAGKRCRIEMITEHNDICFTPSFVVGNNVSINDDVHIGCAYQIIIGDDVLMASKIFISDHQHGGYSGERQHGPDQPPSARPLVCAPVVIGNRVWLGEMVSVLPGVTIGDGSIIGANSVVSRDIPPNTIAVGAPAVPIKRFNSTSRTWERL
jgi:acetyltransferase-like isoleucine patch superfamily enzyme